MTIETTNSKVLKEWLENNQAVLVDVREIFENEAERIAGATLIPLGKVDIDLVPNFVGKKLVIQCRSGKRSLAACEKLVSQNPELEVFNLEGGIEGWKTCGFEITTGANKHKSIPLQLQVEIIAGSIFAIGIILGLTATKFFFLLSGAIALGMSISKITGNCMMTKILQKMPWNRSNH